MKKFIPGILVFLFHAFFMVSCVLPDGLPFVDTPTPTPSQTSTPTPTQTPTPTPSGTPTPIPSGRIDRGDYALFIGDWEAAMMAYEEALSSNPDLEVRIAARLGIARTQYLRGDAASALVTIRDLIDNLAGASESPAVVFTLGQIYSSLGRPEDAEEAYLRYLELKPGVIDAYIQSWRGDALLASGDPDRAIEAYTAAILAPSVLSSDSILFRRANAYAQAGDYDTAHVQFQELYENTSNDYTRASINLIRGQLYAQTGEFDLTYSLYLDSVKNFPLSFDTYQALIFLVENGYPVSEKDRGLIDYFAGQYSLAVSAFDRYLAQRGSETDTSAKYYRALSLRSIDSYDAAISQFENVIETSDASDPLWAEAWDQKADTEWAYLGEYDRAIATYEQFLALVPDHPRAGEFLYYLGRIAERDGQLALAAQNWERVARDYPLDMRAPDAQFLAGITRYRLGEYPKALENFQLGFQKSSDPFESSRTSFWIGKAYLASGDPVRAESAFDRTSRIDPTGYYSERARDFLLNRSPFATPEQIDLAVDWDSERNFAAEWVKFTFAVSETSDLTVPGPLGANPFFVRGTELWHLGLFELSRGEFEALRVQVDGDPVASFRLADHLTQLGLYRTAIFSARAVLDNAGYGDLETLGAPPFFNHIRFGTYYSDLVLPAAADNRLHPLFVYSLIRQESLFEGFVRSSAGARGLMQIIPSTGDAIYSNLGWPSGYSSDDLYRPVINIVFGTDYLRAQRDLFSASPDEPNDASVDLPLYAALAAYNGGPGNSSVWLSLSDNDPDLFVEIIRFEETRRYVRAIYENFNIYRRIYDRSP